MEPGQGPDGVDALDDGVALFMDIFGMQGLPRFGHVRQRGEHDADRRADDRETEGDRQDQPVGLVQVPVGAAGHVPRVSEGCVAGGPVRCEINHR